MPNSSDSTNPASESLPLWGVKDLAQKAGVAQSTIYFWAKSGTIPEAMRLGARYVWTQEQGREIIEFAAKWLEVRKGCRNGK